MGMASPGCFGPGWGRLHLCPACWWHRLPSRGSARIKVKIPDCVCAQLAVGIGHLTTVGGPFVTAHVISDGLGGFSLIWTLPVLLLGALSDRHSSIWWCGCSCDHRAGGSSPPPPGKVKKLDRRSRLWGGGPTSISLATPLTWLAVARALGSQGLVLEPFALASRGGVAGSPRHRLYIKCGPLLRHGPGSGLW